MSCKIVIEKAMALSHAEFVGSMRHIDNDGVSTEPISIPLASGTVRITYRARTARRLGGLLTLPDAIVTLTFIGVDDAARAEFLAHFDRVFQRGGG